MPSDLVLITGVTGHVGFRVLVDALKLGYNVRAAVRDSSKEEAILNAKSVKDLNPGHRLSFFVVPDLTAARAYDEAVKDVQYIIHIASPPPEESDDYENAIIAPAVNGTVGMLQSAHKTPGIRRVVITGSVASIAPTMDILGGNDKLIIDENTNAEALSPPFANFFVAYSSAKITAYKATQDFIARENPAFDVVTVIPSFILGKNELVTDPERITVGSNGHLFTQILGQDTFPLVGHTVHVDDVARVHVSALDPKIPGNASYIVSSGGLDGIVWADALKIVAENYPKAVAAGTLPNNGSRATLPLKLDARKAEEVFGIEFIGFEDQVKSVTEHYLELVGAKVA